MQIATVDKYQGQQNDFILLSLVRTRAVGHIRDVRRLVVAMSRARLGLYVFGRAELFANSSCTCTLLKDLRYDALLMWLLTALEHVRCMCLKLWLLLPLWYQQHLAS